MSIETRPAAQLILSVSLGEDADPEELDQQTRQLRRELLDMDVDTVEFVQHPLPPGAKAGEAVTLGTLAVALAPTLLAKLVDYLLSWTGRSEGRTVTIKTQQGDRSVEVSYTPGTLSREELQDLIKLLVAEPED